MAGQTPVLTRLRRRLPRWLALALSGAGLVLLWVPGAGTARHVLANLLGTYLLVWGAVFLISRAPGAALAAQFILTTITAAIALGALEALALVGVADYRALFGTRQPFYWFQVGNTFDPELLWVRTPHFRARGTWRWPRCTPRPDLDYDLRYDHHGFRNDSDLNAADIAVVGDSFIEAGESSAANTLTAQLGRLTGLTVANLGRSAYGPQQELVVLRRYALPLRPRAIVWAFYEGNDLPDLLSYQEWFATVQRGDARTAPSARDFSFSKNAVYAVLQRLRPCQPDPTRERTVGYFRDQAGRYIKMPFVDWLPALGPRDLVALEQLPRIFASAHELTRGEGIQLVVLFIPVAFRVYKDVVWLPEDSLCREWPGNDLPRRLETMLATISQDIAFVDLTPRLADLGRQGRILYRTDYDSHWTDDGQQVVAEVIGEVVARTRR
jgi:SGNH hydrolase-like domain, acetyltransferase AlgX